MGPRKALTLTGVLLLAAVVVAVLVVGGDGDEEPAPVRREPVDPSLRSARALARGFETVTGDRLELKPGAFFTTASFRGRTLDESGQGDAYYGNFLLFVYPTEEQARAAVRRRGRWSSYGSGFYGSKVLGNVVVQSTFERRRTDAAWGRLLRSLRVARNPAAGPLPAREQLCSERGIELDSGPAGTCKRGAQQFVIRTREMGFRLTGIEIDGVRARRGPRFQAGPLVDEAKGEFVELSFRVRNAGQATIKTRPSYELVVDGRRFEEHDAVYGMRDRYPMRPGESDSDVTLFDVPRALAGDALQRAALEVPGDPAGSFAVSDGFLVGHLRLAGPFGRLQVRPEPEPAPPIEPGLEPA